MDTIPTGATIWGLVSTLIAVFRDKDGQFWCQLSVNGDVYTHCGGCFGQPRTALSYAVTQLRDWLCAVPERRIKLGGSDVRGLS